MILHILQLVVYCENNDKDIFSIKHVISISSEEDLNQFWDYITSSQDSAHDTLHNFVSSFYNFALMYISSVDAHFFEIILEENEENFDLDDIFDF